MNKHAYCVLGALVLSSSAAFSMAQGQNANEVPVVNPVTQKPTDVWKLAGYAPYDGKLVSGVLISPSWIMVAGHSVPPVGTTFGTLFGAARVADCPTSPFPSIDARLCKLNKSLNMPAGFVFPPLVENPDVLAKGRSVETVANDMGEFLSIAYGYPVLGEPIYAWTDFLSMRLDTDVSGLKEAGAPYAMDKDSGSPTFWFSSKTRKVGLIGVRESAGPVGPWFRSEGYDKLRAGSARFTAEFLSYVLSTMAKYGSERVQTMSALEFHGAINPTPSWVGINGRTFISSTPTSVELGWSAPLQHASDVQKYLVQVTQGNQSVRSAFVSASTYRYSFVGLTPNVDYLACVTPIGSGGPAPLGSATWGGPIGIDSPPTAAWSVESSCSAFKLNPAPTAAGSVNVQLTSRPSASGAYPSVQASWTRPTSPALPTEVYYRVGVSKDGGPFQNRIIGPATSTWLDGIVEPGSGKKYCVTVTPFTKPAAYGPTSAVKCTTL